jgi:hypothetical protein
MVEYKLKSKTYLCINADNVICKNVQSSSNHPWNTHLDNTQALQIKFEWKCLETNVTNRALYKAQKDLIPLDGNI